MDRMAVYGREPGAGVMIKFVAAIFAAALLAGLTVTVVPGLSSKVEAHSMAAKGDRLDLKAYGAACSARAWPHFETTCLRDTTSPTREARPVRLVSTDRLPDLRGEVR
jgi:hypothetical protein